MGKDKVKEATLNLQKALLEDQAETTQRIKDASGDLYGALKILRQALEVMSLWAQYVPPGVIPDDFYNLWNEAEIRAGIALQKAEHGVPTKFIQNPGANLRILGSL